MSELAALIGGMGVLLPLLVGLALILYLVPIPLWIAAWASGAYVGLLTLIGMRLRRVPPTTVVTARISAVKAGLEISTQRPRGPLPGRRQRRACGQRDDLGRQGQHPAAVQARRGHRPGRAQRARGGADVGAAQGDRDAQDRRGGQGRHPADRRLPRHGAHQHRPPGRRRRRRDDHRARRRGHGQHHRLGQPATRTCSRTPTTSPSMC